jgi:DMSO/TMAO reductase YedYZ molybdopterin-dependent catalytic subunit/thiosulfate reductase cytochrome b subunit
LPGHRHLGQGRLWHFLSVVFWILTGLVYVGLLSATGEWRRLVPTSWAVVPDAWHALISYLSFHIVESTRYNALQQLAYAAVVFLLSPLAIATGAAMSPAVAARFPWYMRCFGGRQKARSLHFLCLVAFAVFLMVHVSLVVAHGLPHEISLIVLGSDVAGRRVLALALGGLGVALAIVLHVAATSWSLRSPRHVQRSIDGLIDPVRRLLLNRLTSRQRYSRAQISPFFRVNGRPPNDPGYAALVRDNFAVWRLEVGGLVGEPLRLSLGDLRGMPSETQVTKHDCIQGWSAIAEWTGVALRDILLRCRPLPEARYVVFYAYDDKSRSEPNPAGPGFYYETIDLARAGHPQALLAYEMNGAPLTVAHGAPLRLRLEASLGFKMVKYLRAIELVADFRTIGQGHGGWREDVQYYSSEAGI